MPKNQKTRFNRSRITEHLNQWKKAAEDLEKTGKRAYKAIRRYIPKHETELSNVEKGELVDEISMLGFFLRNINLNFSYRH